MKEQKGEYDYDEKHDILSFKAKGKEYRRSVELENVVLHFDVQGNMFGIQIFEASEYLQMGKEHLLHLKNWFFNAEVSENRLTLRLFFQIHDKGKIIEKNPIIQQMLTEQYPNSEIVCTS